MKKSMFLTTAFTMVLGFAALNFAQGEPFVFPKEGQTKEQLGMDKAYCNSWAEDETGLDAGAIRAKLEMAEEQAAQSGQIEKNVFFKDLFKGAAVGAAGGAIDSNIGNRVGAGAAKGTVVGGVLSHEKTKGQMRDEDIRSSDQRVRKLHDDYATYTRAFSACLEAKGYTVK
jgi:hypothetical protein